MLSSGRESPERPSPRTGVITQAAIPPSLRRTKRAPATYTKGALRRAFPFLDSIAVPGRDRGSSRPDRVAGRPDPRGYQISLISCISNG